MYLNYCIHHLFNIFIICQYLFPISRPDYDCIKQSPLYTVIMEQMIALSTQNPLTLLVKFGMMAWNDTCGNENCSGHGECHNGTCLCEVIFMEIIIVLLLCLLYF